MEATATFQRGMKDALKGPRQGIPEYEAIAEVLERGLDLPPGRNLEKLYDRPDGSVYSVRIDAGRRMTIQPLTKQRDVIRFRCIGEHDRVYRQDNEM